jgi:hypothetical protein
MRRAAALVFAAAWTLLAACAPKGDPVRQSLDAIVEAANARDAKRLFEHVSSSFQAADGSGLADAKAMVGRYFAAYEILNVTIRDVRIERGEGAARVRLRAEMSGQPRQIGGLAGLVPTASTYDFDLRLILEDGRWKVAWAEWTAAR